MIAGLIVMLRLRRIARLRSLPIATVRGGEIGGQGGPSSRLVRCMPIKRSASVLKLQPLVLATALSFRNRLLGVAHCCVSNPFRAERCYVGLPK